MSTLRNNIANNLPFISVLTYGGGEYVGIIINQDQFVTSFYDLNAIKTQEEIERFVEIGEIWWWESNRLVPINIFLKNDWVQFRYTLKTFNSKDVILQYGPAVSLKESIAKRGKRRSIVLVRRVI